MRVLSNERAEPGKKERVDSGKAVKNSPKTDKSETEAPPRRIRQMDVIAFALVALLTICVITVLYAAKAFLLPIVAAFVVGTMLSPAATWLERHRIPRSVSAVSIVAAGGLLVAFMIGLISSPVIEWSTRLPELGSLLRDKLHIFDRPVALWQQVVGQSAAPFQMPQVDWLQPTIGFLSPTLTEFLLFFATLVLFIASWQDLRRSLILVFGDRPTRLRVLRILNEIEEHLGSYLLTLTMINIGVGIATGLVCAFSGMPNPAALGALAATLNFLPIIGPVVMFVILTAVGIIAMPTLGAGLLGPAAFAGVAFLEGHFVTPTIIGRKLELNALAVFVSLAFWTWLWGPMGGFLSSPLLIVALILKEHLLPADSPQLPTN